MNLLQAVAIVRDRESRGHEIRSPSSASSKDLKGFRTPEGLEEPPENKYRCFCWVLRLHERESIKEY